MLRYFLCLRNLTIFIVSLSCFSSPFVKTVSLCEVLEQSFGLLARIVSNNLPFPWFIITEISILNPTDNCVQWPPWQATVLNCFFPNSKRKTILNTKCQHYSIKNMPLTKRIKEINTSFKKAKSNWYVKKLKYLTHFFLLQKTCWYLYL